MHKIIMWLGWGAAGLGLFFFLMIVITAQYDRNGQIVAALAIGAGLVVAGAVLHCLGAIVEHLIAIRANSAKQLEIFEKLGKPKP